MNVEQLKLLTPDEFAVYMFNIGKYDVNLDNGEVTNLKSNRKLSPCLNSLGYYVVGLCFNRKLVKQLKVHRLVALKFYGLEALLGKHIAHLNSIKTDNRVINLKPMTPREHVMYDETWKNIICERPKVLINQEKTTKCKVCQSTLGLRNLDNNNIISRISGDRFNIDGKICRTCYRRLQERQLRARKIC